MFIDYFLPGSRLFIRVSSPPFADSEFDTEAAAPPAGLTAACAPACGDPPGTVFAAPPGAASKPDFVAGTPASDDRAFPTAAAPFISAGAATRFFTRIEMRRFDGSVGLFFTRKSWSA